MTTRSVSWLVPVSLEFVTNANLDVAVAEGLAVTQNETNTKSRGEMENTTDYRNKDYNNERGIEGRSRALLFHFF